MKCDKQKLKAILLTTNNIVHWLFLKSHERTFAVPSTWSSFHLSVRTKLHFRTIIGVLPIIPNPVPELSAVCTALKNMQRMSTEVYCPEGKATTILDMAQYKKAVKLVFCYPALKDNFNPRLRALHILMAHLRGIETCIHR